MKLKTRLLLVAVFFLPLLIYGVISTNNKTSSSQEIKTTKNPITNAPADSDIRPIVEAPQQAISTTQRMAAPAQSPSAADIPTAYHTAPTYTPPAQTHTNNNTQTQCSSDMRSSIESLYQSNMNAEQVRYQSALASALGDLQSRGIGFSGQAEVVKSQQLSIHQSKEQAIKSEYENKKAQYGC